MLSHRRRDKFSKIAGMNARIVMCICPTLSEWYCGTQGKCW